MKQASILDLSHCAQGSVLCISLSVWPTHHFPQLCAQSVPPQVLQSFLFLNEVRLGVFKHFEVFLEILLVWLIASLFLKYDFQEFKSFPLV